MKEVELKGKPFGDDFCSTPVPIVYSFVASVLTGPILAFGLSIAMSQDEKPAL